MPYHSQPVQDSHTGVHYKPKIDEDRGTQFVFTVRDFIKKFYSLATAAGKAIDEYGPHTEFALTGRYTDPDTDEKFHARLDPRERSVKRADLNFTCDVDSLISFVQRGQIFPLPAEQCIQYQILKDHGRTLETPIHIAPHVLKKANNKLLYQEYHKIPNVMFGDIGGAAGPITVRMFFPNLTADVRSPEEIKLGSRVSDERNKPFYDRVFYPALKLHLDDLSIKSWPEELEEEKWRAQRANGHFVQTSRKVPSDLLPRVIDSAYEVLDLPENRDLAWARDFFLGIEIKGIKDGTRHKVTPRVVIERQILLPDSDGEDNNKNQYDPDVEDEFYRIRGDVIEKALAPLCVETLITELGDQTYIDIATVISHQDKNISLMYRKSKHPDIVAHLAGLGGVECGRRVNEGWAEGYSFDSWSHMTGHGGFRMELLRLLVLGHHPNEAIYSGLHRTAYLNIYTDDSSLTALKDNNHFAKHMTAPDMYKNLERCYKTYLDPLYDLFHSRRQKKRQISARLESRVKLPFANMCHRDITGLEGAFDQVKSVDLWEWREVRLIAIMTVLDQTDKTIVKMTSDLVHAVATLGVGLCWAANALVARPQAGRDLNLLRDTLSVHERIGLNNKSTRAIQDGGVFFFHSMQLDPKNLLPRVCSHRVLDLQHIAGFIGMNRKSDVAQVARVMNRGHATQLVEQRNKPPTNWGQDDAEEDELTVLLGRGVVGVGPADRSKRQRQERQIVDIPLGPREVDVMADDAHLLPVVPEAAGYLSSPEDDEGPPPVKKLSERLSSIMHRLPGSMLHSAPTIKSGERYSLLNELECRTLRYADLCNSKRLPEFLKTWTQVISLAAWERAVEMMLPTWEECKEKRKKSKTGSYAQGTEKCQWFKDWIGIVANEDQLMAPSDVQQVVTFMRSKLSRQAQWLPNPQKDRMWGFTGAGAGAVVFGTPLDGVNKSPCVSLNPGFAKDARLPGGY